MQNDVYAELFERLASGEIDIDEFLAAVESITLDAVPAVADRGLVGLAPLLPRP
ncbi:hypothetical protein EDD33_2005 [Nocardioides aurantiacus]|uniref:Uncharacterized protein n=1 Tax=Nocardioides aurantiacus TaxID=86796 RepID=A0A3N2CV86_9ACTN|nr:hypothetical protein EDD33_2005 [Nocardioides aurantiacus]